MTYVNSIELYLIIERTIHLHGLLNNFKMLEN